MRVRLELKSRGLDGRIVTRTAWTGRVAGGQTKTINVRPADFPVQSVGSASVVTLDAVIEQSDQPHLVGVRVPSAPLASRFTSDYAGVTLSAQDDTEPSALEPYTTAQTFVNQVSAVGRSLSSSVGRVWNGSAMVDVATLPIVSDNAARYATLRTHVFSPTDASQWDTFFASSPPLLTPDDQDPNGNRVCARISADFIDESRGEAVYGASFPGNGYPAAYALLSIFSSDQNKLLWSGYAGSDGCTPRLQGLSSGRFVMAVESTLRDFRALPPSRDVRVPITGNAPTWLPSRQAVGFRLYAVTPAPATDIRIRLDATDRRMLITAALTQVLRATALSVPSGQYNVRTSRCGGDDVNSSAFTACYSGSTLWLGLNRDPGRTHNAQWKFVVAHEFGHGIQANFNVAPVTNYGAPVAEPACGCEHVFDDADRSHCMQSKETYGGVGNESFGHLISTSTWSGSNPAACTFVYYKETNTAPPAAPLTPPAPVDCAAQVRWLQNQCPEANRGSEWDWNNWYRSVSVAPAAERTTVTDLADIQRRACGGTSCSGLEPSPAQFITAATAKYDGGTQEPRAARFADDANKYGARF